MPAPPGIVRDLLSPTLRENGGGGLVSTMGDYARFGQMLLNKGELDGARILSPAAVELMYTNVVPMDVLKNLQGNQGFNDHVGFGMDFRIVMNPRAIGRMDGKDSYDWGGAAGTWFWVDPENDVVVLGFIHVLGGSGYRLDDRSATLVYQALVDPAK